MSRTDPDYEIPSSWTFERTDIAKNFDKHVREQLPWYSLVTGAVAHIVRHYLPQNGIMYDVGASTGNIGIAVKDTLDDRNAKLISIECASEMVKQYVGPQPENLICQNAVDIAYERFDVAVCFLVLMFLDVEERLKLVDTLKSKMKLGGCIVIVDKVDTDGYFGTILRRLTLAGKVSSGVSSEQIIAKELSLSGVQRPLNKQTVKMLEGLYGAKEFFRFGEFVGWVIEV